VCNRIRPVRLMGRGDGSGFYSEKGAFLTFS